MSIAEPTGTAAKAAPGFGWQWSRFFFRLFLGIVLILQAGSLLGGLRRSLHGSTDFRAFYTAGTLVRTGQGHQLYNPAIEDATERQAISRDDRMLPFLYPAYASWLFVPLSALPYRLAFQCFAAANIACLMLICVYLLPRPAGWPRWSYAVLASSFLPCVTTLLQGQISFLLLLVYAASFRLHRTNPVISGLVLSLAVVKFQLLIPVLIVLLLGQQFLVCAGAVAGIIAVFSLSVVTTGWAQQAVYFRNTLGMAHRTAMDAAGAKLAYGMFPSDMPNLHGFLFTLLGQGRAAMIALLVLSGAVLWAVARSRAALPGALAAAMLVSYHMQAYDLVLLLLPVAFSIQRLRQAKTSVAVWEQTRVWKQAAALLVFAITLLVPPVAVAVLLYGRLSLLVLSCAATCLCCVQISRSERQLPTV